ncbi:ABC transporter permease [Engelhardtia mirabilis]|uniref:Molybdenum transport system permease protein ModB n=1 Tax=Engelhardtia mirabilis TaxID=2528011 RepID=A0A518BLQ8_9BACT|nr:Molybdenum transport system permease protein ModB [Planctomycetes bacterium Pla133]QDV02218.1 Molybdenum transport system permease protein ModB [Planctomycetes bacterium Pla86]
MSRSLVIAACAVFAICALAPILAAYGTVRGDDLEALMDARTWGLLWRTIQLGLGVTAVAVGFGLPFGFLVARTDLPGAGLLRTLGVAPLFVPTLLIAMTWTIFSDVRGAPMTTWVLGLANFPLVAVFAARAAERIDARLEEAARVAGGWRAVLRVDLALILPASACGACLAFTFAVNDFAVPDYVSSVGVKFNVYADEIFANWSQFEAPGLAAASAAPLIALTLAALIPALALRRRGALATLRGGFRPPERIPLGPWRWPAFAFALLVVGLSTLAPLGRLAFEAGGGPHRWRPMSVQAAAAGAEIPTPAAVTEREQAGESTTVSTATYLKTAPRILMAQVSQMGSAFGKAIDKARDDLRRSLTYAVGAATAAVLLGLILGHAIERARRRWVGRSLEVLALLPLAAPATLFAFGAIVLWSRPLTSDLYASQVMVPILFTGRLATFAVLILAGGVASMSRELEDVAATSGAGPARRLFTVVAPNLLGSIAGAWVLVFAFAMRELDAGILVPAANKTAIVRVFNGVHFGRDDYVAALSLLLVFTIVLPGLLWNLFAKRRLEMLP